MRCDAMRLLFLRSLHFTSLHIHCCIQMSHSQALRSPFRMYCTALHCTARNWQQKESHIRRDATRLDDRLRSWQREQSDAEAEPSMKPLRPAAEARDRCDAAAARFDRFLSARLRASRGSGLPGGLLVYSRLLSGHSGGHSRLEARHLCSHCTHGIRMT